MLNVNSEGKSCRYLSSKAVDSLGLRRFGESVAGFLPQDARILVPINNILVASIEQWYQWSSCSEKALALERTSRDVAFVARQSCSNQHERYRY